MQSDGDNFDAKIGENQIQLGCVVKRRSMHE